VESSLSRRAGEQFSSLVRVPVMSVRDVRVLVGERRVSMGMRVRLGDRAFVLVLMVLVVHVEVIVLDRLVRVEVRVTGTRQTDDAQDHPQSPDDVGS
jgi:hypothetical protein